MREPPSPRTAGIMRSEPATEKHARELFERLDKNHDQVVTPQEVDTYRHALLRKAAHLPSSRSTATLEAQKFAASIREVDQLQKELPGDLFQLKMPKLAQLSAGSWAAREGSSVMRAEKIPSASVHAVGELVATLDELFLKKTLPTKDGFLTADELLQHRNMLVTSASLGAPQMNAQQLARRIAQLEVLAANVGSIQALSKDERLMGADRYGITRQDVNALRSWHREMQADPAGDGEPRSRRVAVELARKLNEILDPTDPTRRR